MNSLSIFMLQKSKDRFNQYLTDMNPNTIRKVAIVGYNRIPFARANTAYANVGNQEMMTAALNGLIDKYNLKGKLLGEVAGGAVIKHTYDNNLIRAICSKHAIQELKVPFILPIKLL